MLEKSIPAGTGDRGLRSINLGLNLHGRKLGKEGVIPTVVAYLVTATIHTPQQLLITLDVTAKDKKGGTNMLFI